MNQTQFEGQMSRLYSCFNKNQSERQMTDWFIDLEYHSDKALEHAVDYLRKYEQYFPSFSAVMALVKQYTPLSEKGSIECKYCDEGLIFTMGTMPIHRPNGVVERSGTVSFTFRCPICKQSNMRALQLYPQEPKSGKNIYQFRGGYYKGDISTVIWPNGQKIASDILPIKGI